MVDPSPKPQNFLQFPKSPKSQKLLMMAHHDTLRQKAPKNSSNQNFVLQFFNC